MGRGKPSFCFGEEGEGRQADSGRERRPAYARPEDTASKARRRSKPRRCGLYRTRIFGESRSHPPPHPRPSHPSPWLAAVKHNPSPSPSRPVKGWLGLPLRGRALGGSRALTFPHPTRGLRALRPPFTPMVLYSLLPSLRSRRTSEPTNALESLGPLTPDRLRRALTRRTITSLVPRPTLPGIRSDSSPLTWVALAPTPGPTT